VLPCFSLAIPEGSAEQGAKAANSLNVTLPPHLPSPAREEETKKALVPAESRAEVSYK